MVFPLLITDNRYNASTENAQQCYKASCICETKAWVLFPHYWWEMKARKKHAIYWRLLSLPQYFLQVELNLLILSQIPFLSCRCIRKMMKWVKTGELLWPSWSAIAHKAIAIRLSNRHLPTVEWLLFSFSTTINSMQFRAAWFKLNQNNLPGPRAYTMNIYRSFTSKTFLWVDRAQIFAG